MDWVAKMYPHLNPRMGSASPPGPRPPAARDPVPAALMHEFPPVDFEENTTQKFAEIEVDWGDSASVLIRGVEAAEHHREAAEPTLEKLRRAGFNARITGGGGIRHDPGTIFAFGFSTEYGPADFARVQELCYEAYPDHEFIKLPF